ncbi:unnamed protein product [Fraxinus pennsylvanica]|uniref:Pentatricopeptide repeat-containing protein n=1 Tax=Fraxinus pennsylvanica TaxID=56036 RepID=A0AAD2A3W7_9LAMI|nr:unnamed protein product [Fraxinus pennsylvanica]
MTCVGVSPSFLSLNSLVECFVHFNVPELALAVPGIILKCGFSINVYVANLVLKGLCYKGKFVKAVEFLDEMGRNFVLPDVVSFNTLIKGLCTVRNLNEARYEV